MAAVIHQRHQRQSHRAKTLHLRLRLPRPALQDTHRTLCHTSEKRHHLREPHDSLFRRGALRRVLRQIPRAIRRLHPIHHRQTIRQVGKQVGRKETQRTQRQAHASLQPRREEDTRLHQENDGTHHIPTLPATQRLDVRRPQLYAEYVSELSIQKRLLRLRP